MTRPSTDCLLAGHVIQCTFPIQNTFGSCFLELLAFTTGWMESIVNSWLESTTDGGVRWNSPSSELLRLPRILLHVSLLSRLWSLLPRYRESTDDEPRFHPLVSNVTADTWLLLKTALCSSSSFSCNDGCFHTYLSPPFWFMGCFAVVRARFWTVKMVPWLCQQG